MDREHMYLGHSVLHSLKPDYDYQNKIVRYIYGETYEGQHRRESKCKRINVTFVTLFYILFLDCSVIRGQACSALRSPLWWYGEGWHWTHTNQCRQFTAAGLKQAHSLSFISKGWGWMEEKHSVLHELFLLIMFLPYYRDKMS